MKDASRKDDPAPARCERHQDPLRVRIDPGDRYPGNNEGLRAVEHYATELCELLPDWAFERTRDAFQFSEPGEDGLVLLVTAEAVELRLPVTEWDGVSASAKTSALWKRLLWQRTTPAKVVKLLAKARQARQDQFVKCRFCGEPTPPEFRHDDVCHGCAEKHLGYVH